MFSCSITLLSFSHYPDPSFSNYSLKVCQYANIWVKILRAFKNPYVQNFQNPYVLEFQEVNYIMLHSQHIVLIEANVSLTKSRCITIFTLHILLVINSVCTSILFWQIQMKLMEMKELENHNNQLNWCSSPHGILVNGTADYCSLSTSSSETANLNEHAEGPSNLESEPIHQESPVSLIVP